MTRTILTISLLLLFPGGFARAQGVPDDLKDRLRHFSYKERIAAIQELEAIGGEAAARAIASVIGDKDWAVQVRALKALGRLEASDTIETVAKALVEGEIILVRQAAVDALKAMGGEGIYRRLLKGVARGRNETQKIRALEAAYGLAGPGDVDAIAPFTGDRDMKIKAAAVKLSGAKAIDKQRAAFKELSRPLAMWVTMSKPAGLNVVYCSMAKGSWLQSEKTIANPYYGAKMLRCGEVVAGKHKGTAGGHMKH